MDPDYFGKLDPNPALEGKAGFGSPLKSTFRSFRGSKWSPGGPWMLIIEGVPEV
jgi:hypothetical protein